ncbi:MAG: hypothetical protein WDL87_09120 [Candidatus Omnitrophota bacterium]|jgi:hypothetical protein
MAKSEHLVCQHLENISSEALEKYQKIIRHYVRRRSGIYALYRNDRLYYVGLAHNLRSRLKGHLRDRHKKLWNRFSVYLTIGSEHMKELESLVLRISKPIGNKVKGKFKKSENLQRHFAKDIRDSQKNEFNRLLGREMTRLVLDGKERQEKKAVLAKYMQSFRQSLRLRTRYKGKKCRAFVRRNGIIMVNGKKFYSPSMAGKSIAAKGTAVNGWFFWEYERAPGDWVCLNELRK